MDTKSQRYIHRETLVFNGTPYEVSTTSADHMAWVEMYHKGIRVNRYPLPAIMQGFEFGWSLSDSKPALLHWEWGPYWG